MESAIFFGFDSETVIGHSFTRFANPVSVSLVKQAVSLKPKLEPVSVSSKGSRPYCVNCRVRTGCFIAAQYCGYFATQLIAAFYIITAVTKHFGI